MRARPAGQSHAGHGLAATAPPGGRIRAGAGPGQGGL